VGQIRSLHVMIVDVVIDS